MPAHANRFRQPLEPPTSRRVEREIRRPFLCVIVTFGVMLLIFTIFGMSALNVYQHKFHKNTYYFHLGDEVALSQVAGDLSSTFCDAYKVSMWASGDVYLLPHHPTVNNTIADTTHIEIHQLPERTFNVKSVYLLKQSIIDVTACRENGSAAFDAHMFLVRGADDFKKWRQNKNCHTCVLKRVPVPHDADCDDTTSEKLAKLKHVVQGNDKYYLGISYDNQIPFPHARELGIFVNGSIARTHFNTDDAEEMCFIEKDSFCQFKLPWNSDKDVVVKFEHFRGMSFRRTLTTQCQVRLVFWVLLFAIVPVVCMIPISVLTGCCLCRRRPRSQEDVKRLSSKKQRRAQDKDVLVHHEIVQAPEGGSMTIQDDG